MPVGVPNWAAWWLMVHSSLSSNLGVAFSSRTGVPSGGLANVRIVRPWLPARQKYVLPAPLQKRLSTFAISLAVFLKLAMLSQILTPWLSFTTTMMHASNCPTTWPQMLSSTSSFAKTRFGSGPKTTLFTLSIFQGRSILLTYSPKKCAMVRTSNISGTHSCPVFLILCTTPSSLFTTPPGALQLWLLPRLLVSVPPVAHWVISLPSSLLPFSVVSRTSHTYAVQVGISLFVVFMLSDIFWDFPFLFFCWMQGQGVLVCPWSSSRASRSNLTLISLTSRSPNGSFHNISLKDWLKSVDLTEFSQCNSTTDLQQS